MVDAKAVIVDILGVLAVNSVKLSVGGSLREERRDEKLREAVECAIEMLRVDVEEVHRIFAVGVGVGRPAVSREKGSEVLLVGIRFRPEEGHVFTEVGEAGDVFRIGEGPDVNIHCCGTAA